MECPKCGKKLSPNVKVTEEDGGIVVTFECEKCVSTFEAFIGPVDLEEIFEI